LKQDFWVHAVVDGATILGHECKYLHAGAPRSADELLRRLALQKGLGWLVVSFGYDKPDRRQGTPASPKTAAARNRRPGLEVYFNEQDGRPDPADVAEAVARLSKS
jgi:hypothetical protein